MVSCVVESGKLAVPTECDGMSGGIRSNCGRTLLKVPPIVAYSAEITYNVECTGTNVMS